ncbi:helix-turn-helix domain-containing protein [Actinophytocola sp.]|uniref:helix-turn-helix domain-containing protein n=1 Tax=Actinophytocola sp. TaxID=1872138 RepID=UPI003D6B43A5
MNSAVSDPDRPVFYTVREAAKILRCDKNTLYRAIHDDAFPAVKLRSRFVIPAAALDRLIAEAADTQGCVDVAQMAARRRDEREFARVTGRAS